MLFVNKKHCPVLRTDFKKCYSPNTALKIVSSRKIACADLTHKVLADLMVDNIICAKFRQYGCLQEAVLSNTTTPPYSANLFPSLCS